MHTVCVPICHPPVLPFSKTPVFGKQKNQSINFQWKNEEGSKNAYGIRNIKSLKFISELTKTVHTHIAISSTFLALSAQKSILIVIDDLGCTMPMVGRITMGNSPLYCVLNLPKENKVNKLYLYYYDFEFVLLVKDKSTLQNGCSD